MEGIDSSILFFLIISLGGGMLLHSTIFKSSSLKEFWLLFAGAIVGCGLAFALPWALYFSMS